MNIEIRTDRVVCMVCICIQTCLVYVLYVHADYTLKGRDDAITLYTMIYVRKEIME